MKFSEFVSEIIKSLWAWIGLVMDIISGIIYANPDLVEKFSFLNVVQKYLFVWIVLGTFLIIWSSWKVTNKILKGREALTPSNFTHVEENNAPILNNSNGNTFNTQNNDIKVILPDRKKKENKPFNTNSLDFRFHRRWRHSRFTIYEAKLNSLLDYIKNGIATLFLHYQESELISYEIDHSESKYRNPNIDNVVYHGVVFAGIKKVFEINPEGKKVKKEEIKMDLLFTIYVEQIKKANKNTEIDIVMDGDGLYAEYFFNEFQKYIGKRFRVSPVKRDE